MASSFMHIYLLCHVILLPFLLSESAEVVVNAVLAWKNPQVQIGDSVIFQLKFHYNLYIFRNKKAFNLCNFTQATVLTEPDSTSYTWHTSRPGFFYFSSNNGSNKACLEGQKLAVKVLLPPPQDHATSPELPPQAGAPPSSSGGIVVSSSAFPWPFQPREIASPTPAPSLSLPATSPVTADRDGIPFISSNPAVPLPTGDVDAATIGPLPTSGHQHSKQVVGFSAVHIALSCISLLLMMII